MVREVIVNERFVSRQSRSSHGNTLQRNEKKIVSIGSESSFLGHLLHAEQWKLYPIQTEGSP
jgi:hypothetical protein